MSNMKTELAYYREILEGKHKATVNAWLEGATIQILCEDGWADYDDPFWVPTCSYRVKPNFIPSAYYKVTLKHIAMTQVMRYSTTRPYTFVDYRGIHWMPEEFSTEPEFIC